MSLHRSLAIALGALTILAATSASQAQRNPRAPADVQKSYCPVWDDG